LLISILSSGVTMVWLLRHSKMTGLHVQKGYFESDGPLPEEVMGDGWLQWFLTVHLLLKCIVI